MAKVKPFPKFPAAFKVIHAPENKSMENRMKKTKNKTVFCTLKGEGPKGRTECRKHPSESL